MADAYSFDRMQPDKQWVRRWRVRKNTSDTTYVVAMQADGQWGCSCPNWKFAKSTAQHATEGVRADCKHIRMIKQFEPKNYIDEALTKNAKPKVIPVPVQAPVAPVAVFACHMCHQKVPRNFMRWRGKPICESCFSLASAVQADIDRQANKDLVDRMQLTSSADSMLLVKSKKRIITIRKKEES